MDGDVGLPNADAVETSCTMSVLPRSIVFLALTLLASGADNAASAPSPGPESKVTATFELRLKPSVDPKTGKERAVDADALVATENALQKRCAAPGTVNVTFTRQPPDRLTVRAEDLALVQVAALRKALTYLAVLDFRMVHRDNDTLLPEIEAKRVELDPAWVVLPTKEDRQGEAKPRRLIVQKVPEISGSEIIDAYAFYDVEGWGLGAKFNDKAAEKFFQITRQMRVAVDRFAIVLDGEILSAPTTQVAGGIAGGSFRLTGRFTEQEARDLAAALMNPFSNPVVIEREAVK